MMQFEPYPFEKLSKILDGIAPQTDPREIIKLTIGEPQFETPQNIQNALMDFAHLLCKYPASAGEVFLKNAQLDFIKRRFGVELDFREIIPTLGTREVLFNFPQFVFGALFPQNRVMAFPNPFYQIYEGAGIASNAEIIYMDLDSDFVPQISDSDLKRAKLVILNSPNNPTGALLSQEQLEAWVKKALEYDFILLNDECYSEIYVDSAPVSILQASCAVGNDDFKNILCVNSISKRSSAPGLRSGFIAGDAEILAKYGQYRTYIGCAIPLPLQRAAAVAWGDDKSAEIFRQKYAQNLRVARDILQIPVNLQTFYIWLKVNDDIAFTQELYANEGILVLPGRFLGRKGAGENFVRLALVYEAEIIQNALRRIKSWI